jgi:hypothetical protein
MDAREVSTVLEILNQSYDRVIKSICLTAVADYSFALSKLVPLIDKLEFQRSPLRKAFYNRLENDIENGCIMPFLTIAMKQEVSEEQICSGAYADEKKLLSLFENAFVLDGIQRLNTLKRVAQKPGFDSGRPIFFNILICASMDRLLYRMVTLNNGQKPMTARHQIEVLASNIFDFDNLPIIASTEKQAKGRKKGDNESVITKEILIKAYIAYISCSVNIDNQKIIESKMDELITEQIMESNITARDTQYNDVINYVVECLGSEPLKKWFSVPNNFIGFSSAMSIAFCKIVEVVPGDLVVAIELFEDAFSAIDVSKIKLGMARRRMVKYFFENFDKFSGLEKNKLLDKISMEL